MNYLLGDTDIAARRLALVAKAFAPSTEAFLREFSPGQPEVAIDLGCGPGHTTRLLDRVLKPRQTIGLDCSEKFIQRARVGDDGKISFCIYDVTAPAFPCPQADLIFSRFLLMHVKDPLDAVIRWVGQLKPGGTLLIEELEGIITSCRQIQAYLSLLDAALKDQGKFLYIGQKLTDLSKTDLSLMASGIKLNRIQRIGLPQTVAAEMFHMNMATLKRRKPVLINYPPEELDQIEADLSSLARSGDSKKVTWRLRQMVIAKAKE